MRICSDVCYAIENIAIGITRVKLKELVYCNSGIVKFLGLKGFVSSVGFEYQFRCAHRNINLFIQESDFYIDELEGKFLNLVCDVVAGWRSACRCRFRVQH
jgi:hypothetical protein